MTATKQKYISIPQLAKFLGVSRVTVYKRVRSGQIKAERIGRNYAIPVKYIADILGRELAEPERAEIERAVKRVVKEYGEVLELLGQE